MHEKDGYVIYNWDYWIIEKDTDFILTEWDVDWLPTLYEQDDIYFEYNQANQSWSKLSCTIFNPVWAISDLWNYEFPLEQIKEIDSLSYEKWRKKWAWRRTNLSVDLLRNWWNNNKELVKKYWKIASYRVSMLNDALIKKILDKNYTLCTSFQWNTDYILDYYYDWVLDNYDFWKKTTYGHSVSIRNHNWKKCVKDNYKWRKWANWIDTNFYEVKPERSQLVKSWIFRANAYLFTKVKEDNYDELIRLEKVKVKCINSLNANSDLWNNTNDNTLKKKLHDTNEWIRNNNLKYIEENLIKLR